MARYIDVDKLDKLFGEPTEVFLSRLDLKMPPTADVRENVHGEWVEDSPLVKKCSKCGYHDFDWRTKNYNFCPHCGYRMEEGEQDE